MKQADTAAVVEAKAEEKAAVAAKNTHPKPEKVDIEAPPAPHLIVRPRWDEEDTKQQIKCTLLSLDGLLDYNQDDVCEKVHPTPQALYLPGAAVDLRA